MMNFADKPLPKLYKPIGWKTMKVKTIDESLVDLNDRILVDCYYTKRYKRNCYQLLLRESAAKLLFKANEYLKKNYQMQMIVFEALVPPALQKKFFLSTEQIFLKKYLNKKIARRETLKHISLPTPISPHNSGGTVDVNLANMNCKLLYMGTSTDEYNEKTNPLYFEKSKSKKDLLYRNRRRILFWTMHKFGFKMNPTNWWHFSYKDRPWLAINKQLEPSFDSPIYGPVVKQNLKI